MSPCINSTARSSRDQYDCAHFLWARFFLSSDSCPQEIFLLGQRKQKCAGPSGEHRCDRRSSHKWRVIQPNASSPSAPSLGKNLGNRRQQKRRCGESFQPRISTAKSRTCSAIEGAEVSPGDSIPISWTTDRNCGSRSITKSATRFSPRLPGGVNFARMPEYAGMRSEGSSFGRSSFAPRANSSTCSRPRS